MSDVSKLDRLLDLRRHEEQQRTQELAHARQAVADARKALELLVAQRRVMEARDSAGAEGSVGDLKTARLLLEQIDISINNARGVLSAALTVVDEKHEQFLAANQDRQALERVVIPRRQQQQMLLDLDERKQQDEVALVQYRQRGVTSS